MAAQQHGAPTSPASVALTSPQSPVPSLVSNIPDKKKAAMLIEYFERTSKDRGPSVTVRINPTSPHKSRTRPDSSYVYEAELVKDLSPSNSRTRARSIPGDGEFKPFPSHPSPEPDHKSSEFPPSNFVQKGEKSYFTHVDPDILDQIISAAIERMVLPELRLLREERAAAFNDIQGSKSQNLTGTKGITSPKPPVITPPEQLDPKNTSTLTGVNDITPDTKEFATPETALFFQENDSDNNYEGSITVRASKSRNPTASRHSRTFIHSQWSPESTPPPPAKWSGASRHSMSKDVLTLMNHLATQDAQRHARDEEIMRTISQLSAEIKHGIDELKVTISEEEQDTVKLIERKINMLSASDYPRPLGPRPMLSLTVDPEEKKTLYDRLFGQGKHKKRALDRIERLCLEVAYDVRKIEQKMGRVGPFMDEVDASESDSNRFPHHDIRSRGEEHLDLDEDSVKRHWDKLIKSIHGDDEYDEADEPPLRTPQTHFNSPQPPGSMPLSERRVWEDSFHPTPPFHNQSLESFPSQHFTSGLDHSSNAPESSRLVPNRSTGLQTPPVIRGRSPQSAHSPKLSMDSTGPPTPPSKSPLKNNLQRIERAKTNTPSRKPHRMNEEYSEADDDENAHHDSGPITPSAKNKKSFGKRFSKITSDFMSDALAAFKVQKGEPKNPEISRSDDEWESEVERQRQEEGKQRSKERKGMEKQAERDRPKRRLNRTKRLEKNKTNDVVEEIIYDEPEVQAPMFESPRGREEFDTNFTPQPYENVDAQKDKENKILRKKTSEKLPPHMHETLIHMEARQNNIVNNPYAASSHAEDVFVSAEVPIHRSTARLQRTSPSKSSRKPTGPRPLSVASKRGHTERSFEDDDLPPPQPSEQDSRSWNVMFPGARLRSQTKNGVEI
ncbi:hypothetical protein NEOLI_003591 [Neolecta irregularis DAH-3]|uniref:Uncharacterized protein n=1 Tax=Neolecta irregularis (strain DAH-3) TaxID=1198029 RepID=A0A1U7LPZ0_NEOID|nr:hypothetical protein NEOLI_003591 [Neolecta irregularis DAH-3]|eukprot:OLL24740.1 hypothetical protein NEOLI_003591 [Neolecta irregularis DAH-3]